MEQHQEHFGRKFYQDKKMLYWISTDYPRIRAHRWVWINSHGVIPKGYHIHHKDEDKSNNDISNLELISASQHCLLHWTPEKKKRAAIHCDKIRPLTKKWHTSAEGLAWHKLHALKCKFGKNEPKDFICQICYTSFKSSKLSNVKFCSNNCKSQWRRNSGLDDIQVECFRCYTPFTKNKYAKTVHCSKQCAADTRSNIK